jgi:hypothetical protein
MLTTCWKNDGEMVEIERLGLGTKGGVGLRGCTIRRDIGTVRDKTKFQTHAHETHIHEMHAPEMHAREVHAHETHAYEIHALEMHARKVLGENP